METSVKATCNWRRSGGCDFEKAIQTKITHEDIFIKPELDELLTEDRAILLEYSTSNSTAGEDNAVPPCELQLRVFPRYKIESLTIVCSAPKVELFLGPLKEYAETVYGSEISDNEGNEPLEKIDSEQLEPAFPSYRYDIEVKKSGIVDLTLKLLPITAEICIYGTLLQLAPNPNGITTLLPTAINMENVQQILANSSIKLSPSAEKCKMFMGLAKKSVVLGQSPLTAAVFTESLKEQLPLSEATSKVAAAVSDVELKPTFDNILKSHIDRRLGELEARLNVRLHAIEAQQTDKFNQILELLKQRM